MNLKKYIFIFGFVNVTAFILLFIINAYFNNKLNKCEDEIDNLKNRVVLAHDIDETLSDIEFLFFELGIYKDNRILRKFIEDKIHIDLKKIYNILFIMKNGGKYKQKIILNLEQKSFIVNLVEYNKPDISLENISILPKMKYLENKMLKINGYIEEGNGVLLKRELKLIPSIIKRMKENANRLIYETNILVDKKNRVLEKERIKSKNILLTLVVFIIIFIFVMFFIILREILKLYKESEYRLFHDSLTGLKNRRALEKELENGNSSTLFLIDIEGFKYYNEIYGNSIGNKILEIFSNLLMDIRKNCAFDVKLYRVSGDTFGFLSNEKLENPLECGDKIRNRIIENSILIVENEIEIDIDVKIGIAEGDAELIEKSSVSLNEAKLLQKKVLFLKDNFIEKQSSIKNAILWQKRIREAIEEDRIVPFFQPILDKDWNIVKYEGLMRLKMVENGEEKYIPPFFLDLARKNGQYLKLSQLSLSKIFEKFSKEGSFSFNLNYLDIKDEYMRDFIIGLFNKYANIGERITIEILEDESIENYKILEDFILKLRDYYGVQIAIDDFGSGYSNFKRILDIKPDFIKIDGSLIKNIDKDITSRILVESMVIYAHKIGIKVVAEYIHSKSIFDSCVELDVDYFQGYYFSPAKLEL